MALKKFARRDVILPAVVFLLTFAVALFKSGRPCITKTALRMSYVIRVFLQDSRVLPE